MKKRRKLFSVTRKDFEIQTFRAGGKGGQNQNKRDTGVRIIHAASGAVGESRTERSQYQNRKLALERLARSDRFMCWVRLEAARVTGRMDEIEHKIDEMMHPRNLKIEAKDERGRWVEYAE
jgi:protein subunit release factor B